jgi:hypothetical protein
MNRLAGILLVASLAGCGTSTSQVHLPSEAEARQALEAALAAWQKGRPPGAVPDRSPSVQFVDSSRQAGQKLVGYEVLGAVPSDQRRTFVVRLRLENPAETPKVRFCVLGADPLWVFREDELEMIGHWACGAEDSDPQKAKTAATGPRSNYEDSKDKQGPHERPAPLRGAKGPGD